MSTVRCCACHKPMNTEAPGSIYADDDRELYCPGCFEGRQADAQQERAQAARIIPATYTSPTMRGYYGKGRSAAQSGLPRKCPYEPLPYQEKQRRAWLAGWDDAQSKQPEKASAR